VAAVKRRVKDVMTTTVAVVTTETPFKEIVHRLAEHRVAALPVIDAREHVVGVVSEADLLLKEEHPEPRPGPLFESRRRSTERRKASGALAGQLMTAPAVTVRATETVTGAARLMEAARIKRMPVVDEQGGLVGIVSRRDLVRLYTRPDSEVRRSVAEGVLRSLWIDPAMLEIRVRSGIVTLAGHLDRRSTCEIVVAFSKATPGVVDVVDELTYDFDDSDVVESGWYRSHPFSAETEHLELH